jgi:hypothetical protein
LIYERIRTKNKIDAMRWCLARLYYFMRRVIAQGRSGQSQNHLLWIFPLLKGYLKNYE